MLRKRVKKYVPDYLLRLKWAVHRYVEQRKIKKRPPIILSDEYCSDEHTNSTVVIVCGPHFNQQTPNAMTKHRLGMANGFKELGIDCHYVSFLELHTIRNLSDPLIFIQEADYEYLGRSQVNELRKYKKFVWVDPWLDDIKRFTLR